MKIGIGIDTGGTYTDAIVYDFEEKEILGSAKALTTKDDLSVGILGALDALPYDFVQKAEVISLSTTLATNACVEDNGGSAKLLFFGGNKKVIDELGGKYGLPPAKDIYIQDSYTHFSGEIDREPEWDLFMNSMESEAENFDGIGIIEMNAMKNGAVVEKKAKELLQEKYTLPVICGHELFSELNCLQRGSSTLLNARLIPVIGEFLDAIKTAMQKRGINAEIVIVRSDGSLMSEEFTLIRPVETLLCGPAASVIGGKYLSDNANSIIIDMGGTTTDMALIKNHIPVTVLDGVSIGKWRTFVDGLYVKTFGLGGDSAIHYSSNKLLLEEYRVIPLCVAAAQNPQVIENLKVLSESTGKHTMFLHEHYILIKDIEHMKRYTAEEKAFCEALKKGPLILRDAAKVMDCDIYNLKVSRLLKEGIIQICGLTPTDIMHIKGDFSKYSKEASMLGAQFVAMNLDVSISELCDMVYDEIKRKIYVNIVKVLLENKDKNYMKNGVSKEIEHFINESYELAKTGLKSDYLTMGFTTEFSLVGIGAPVPVFLKDVAKMLRTKAIIPPYFEVANALGSLVGNVSVTYVTKIRPNCDKDGMMGYIVFGNDESKRFEELEDAEEFAVSQAREGAKAEAVIRGARGEITISSSLKTNEAQAKNGMIYLGTDAVAHAVGSIGF